MYETGTPGRQAGREDPFMSVFLCDQALIRSYLPLYVLVLSAKVQVQFVAVLGCFQQVFTCLIIRLVFGCYTDLIIRLYHISVQKPRYYISQSLLVSVIMSDVRQRLGEMVPMYCFVLFMFSIIGPMPLNFVRHTLILSFDKFPFVMWLLTKLIS